MQVVSKTCHVGLFIHEAANHFVSGRLLGRLRRQKVLFECRQLVSQRGVLFDQLANLRTAIYDVN